MHETLGKRPTRTFRAVEVALVPWPAVIVPPVIDHTYEAPGPASGTLAKWPVAFSQTLAGALTTQLGAALTATIDCPPHAQPALLVTATSIVTLGPAPASNVIALVPWISYAVPVAMGMYQAPR